MDNENQQEQVQEEQAEEMPQAGSEEAAEEKSLEVQLEEALAEAAELKDKMLRIAADFENTKKRMEKERLAALKYAGENIFREILPSIDNLDRALEQSGGGAADAEQRFTALMEGVALIKKNLLTTLEKFEVKPFDSVGEAFDPNRQEALTMEPNDEIPANHVLTEYEKGYFYKDRLLRAAKVVVSSGRAE